MKKSTDAEFLDARSAASLFESLQPLRVRYARDELICREGSFAAGLQIITQGYVIETTGDTGQRRSAGSAELLGPGDLIGLVALLPQSEDLHRVSCRSLTEVQLLFLDRATVDRTVAEDPNLASTLLAQLSARHFRVKRALARAHLPPTARLCATLLDAATMCASEPGQGVVSFPPEMDLRALGDLAGLSPAQARRATQRLPGIWTTRGQVTVRPAALEMWRLDESPDGEEPSEGLLHDR